MLSALLLFLTFQSTKSAVTLYKRETLALQEAAKFALQNTDEEKKLIPILAYDRARLEKEHYIPDIRYIRDENQYPKSDWTKDEDELSDDEGRPSGSNFYDSQKSLTQKLDEEYNNQSPDGDPGPAQATTSLLRRHSKSAPYLSLTR